MAILEPQMDKEDTLRLLRANLSSLRENVVLAVMRRNKLSDEVTKLEHHIADLETKASLSEKINPNSMLAGELREERTSREAELHRLRPLLRAAEQEAEGAKMRLPDEEARLKKQIEEVENGFTPPALTFSSPDVPAAPASTPVTLETSEEAESLFNRAAEKTQLLTQEAQAREEVSPLMHPAPPTVQAASPAPAVSEEETGSFFDPPPVPIAIPKIIEPETHETASFAPEPAPERTPASPFAEEAKPVLSETKTPEEMLRELEERLNLVQASIAAPALSGSGLSASGSNFLELDPPVSETPPEPAPVAETVPSPPRKRELYIPPNLLLVNTSPAGSAKPKKNGKTELEPEAAHKEDNASLKTAVSVEAPVQAAVAATLGDLSLSQAEPVSPTLETGEKAPEETLLHEPAESLPFAEGAALAEVTTAATPVNFKGEPEEESAASEPVAKATEAAKFVPEKALPSAPAPEAADIVEARTPQEQISKVSELMPETAAAPKIEPFNLKPAPTPVSLPLPAPAATRKTERVRVAGIGTGGIWRGAHAPAYVDIPQMQLAAICDPDKTAQMLALKRYEELVTKKVAALRERGDSAGADELERDRDTLQVCDDLSEVIAKIKPDLVDICTQPMLHAPLSIQALEAGIHVMCEKPLTRSWLESKRLIETVQKTGKLYQHNENWLWDQDYYTAKKLIDAGAIGEPILMYLATAHGGPEGNPNFWNPDFGGGGALLDNGIHAIGAAWFLSGLQKKPSLVKAAEPFGMSIRMPQRILDGRYQEIRVEDDAHILIRFEDAESLAWTTAHVEGSWSHRDSPDTAIFGTTGKIQFKDENGHRSAVVLDAYDREARRIEVSGPTWSHWPSSHYGEILNMVECVRSGTPSICTAEFGAECSAIVGAAYLSEMSGRKAVPVDDFKRFAEKIADRYPHDPRGADDALVEALLSAVRK